MAAKILVTGGTGAVGSEVVKRLLSAGVPVRATTRRPPLDPGTAGVEWLPFEVGARGAECGRLLDGIERVFLMAPTGYVDQYALLSPWIEAARVSRVARVVLMTAQGVDADDRIPFRRAELELIDAGLGYAILRPAWFMQNFHTFWGHGIRRQGVLAVPAGDGRLVFVDTRDVAEVAATLLLADSVEDQAVDVTGPEACDHAYAAAVLAAATGRSVRYENVAPEVCFRTLVAWGMPDDYAGLVLEMFAEVRDGGAVNVTNVVERITGHRPRDLATYARDYRAHLS
jgi:uncharacterized protein YbjT (DUF2867 family)